MTPASSSGVLSPFAPFEGPAIGLDGLWRTAPAPTNGHLREDYTQPDFDDSAWEAVRLPHLGRATHRHDTLWYRCRFSTPRPQGEHLLLHFGGAFYFAEVWLNGRALGRHEGYFQPFAFDVTDLIAPGDNLLAVRCHFPIEADAFKRKTAIAGIFADWDCKPYPSPLYPNLPPPHEWSVPVGLWQPVQLRRPRPVLIESLNIFPHIDNPRWPGDETAPGADEARLEIKVRLRNLSGEAVNTSLAWEIAPHNFTAAVQVRGVETVRLEPGAVRELTFEARLPQPRLWFPWSHGQPWLYALRARTQPAGDWETIQVFGVRQIEADFGQGRWEWRLNGRRIFPKGSNYIAEFYLDRATPEGMSRDIRMAREANLDMLRVHGHIAPPDFYRLCDEQGMLVMCDFPLIWTYGHNIAPADAAQFTAQVQSQARDMVDLLASRPSIALWSMHNEPPWTPTGEFLGSDVHQARTNETSDMEAAALVRRLDSTRPATPASGLYDQHLYHGWYTGAWLDNRDLRPPFPTEFGVQALPNPDSPVWAGLNSDWPISSSDPSWAHAGYQSVFWARPGVGPPRNFDSLADYIHAGQEYQAFFIRHIIDQWRRQKFQPVGGYIHFLFTDGWPAITWSVLDYHRLPKLGYTALAEASRPVRLCIDPHDNFHVEEGFKVVYPQGGEMRATLYLVNDDYRQRGSVRVKWRLERQGRTALGRLLNRVAQALRQEGTTIDLPAADAEALPIGSLTVPLRHAGEYILHTEVVGAAGVLDYNSHRFRVGEPRPWRRILRRVPGWLVSKVYQTGSLRREGDGIAFALHNPAMPVALERLSHVTVDGTPLPPEQVFLVLEREDQPATLQSANEPLEVASGQHLWVILRGVTLEAGRHEIEITARVKGLGEISARVRDRLE